MKYFIIALALMGSGCASVFEEQAYWPDSAYGGPLEKVALETYRSTHSRWLTPLDTAPSGHGYKTTMADMHINPAATVICTTHTSMVMKELDARGVKYEVLLLKETPWLWHSVVKVGNEVIDINEREPYNYAENYKGRYMEERNLGQVSHKEFGREILLVSFK